MPPGEEGTTPSPPQPLWSRYEDSSSVSQYAADTNFCQDAFIRNLPIASDGFHTGAAGCRASLSPACRAVRLAFRALQGVQATTQFVHSDRPPLDLGRTWSMDSSSVPGLDPQYWQV